MGWGRVGMTTPFNFLNGIGMKIVLNKRDGVKTGRGWDGGDPF